MSSADSDDWRVLLPRRSTGGVALALGVELRRKRPRRRAALGEPAAAHRDRARPGEGSGRAVPRRAAAHAQRRGERLDPGGRRLGCGAPARPALPDRPFTVVRRPAEHLARLAAVRHRGGLAAAGSGRLTAAVAASGRCRLARDPARTHRAEHAAALVRRDPDRRRHPRRTRRGTCRHGRGGGLRRDLRGPGSAPDRRRRRLRAPRGRSRIDLVLGPVALSDSVRALLAAPSTVTVAPVDRAAFFREAYPLLRRGAQVRAGTRRVTAPTAPSGADARARLPSGRRHRVRPVLGLSRLRAFPARRQAGTVRDP